MNLAADKWIPVVRLEGQHDEVSLTTAFTEGDRIADLAARPPERIALMRLLLCGAHAALDPTGKAPRPRNQDDWEACRSELPQAAKAYLSKWHDAFELFGDQKRFLQIPDLVPEKSDGDVDDNSAKPDQLDPVYAVGNNTTLFDNAGGSPRSFAPVQLARMLVNFQSFALMKPIGPVRWGKGTTKRNGAKGHALCLGNSFLHAFILGRNLLETIHWNMVSREMFQDRFDRLGDWGRPIWECFPASLSDSTAIANATTTYLGRLVPMSRAVKISDNGLSLVRGFSFEYPQFPDFRAEPSNTEIANVKAQRRQLLKTEPGKALWRQVPSILVLAKGDKPGGPLALRNIPAGTEFSLWVGGIATGPWNGRKRARSDASVRDAVESVFPGVPHSLLIDVADQDTLTEERRRNLYVAGVAFAEAFGQKTLWKAIHFYHLALSHQANTSGDLSALFTGLRKRSKQSERGHLASVNAHAATAFWTKLENSGLDLVAMAKAPVQTTDAWRHIAASNWGRAVQFAALDAYDISCPHATPRQMKAYVLGRAVLIRPDNEPADENETQEETE